VDASYKHWLVVVPWLSDSLLWTFPEEFIAISFGMPGKLKINLSRAMYLVELKVLVCPA
jgi:hypothetical protein